MARDRESSGSQPGMPAEHALLALLDQRDDGASHGYELARQFDEGQPLGNIIRLEAGMIYHHLKKLERLGWVSSSSVKGERTARRTVQLTERGREELRLWLTAPVAHTREIRLEFLVKLYFALQIDAAHASRLVSEQRQACLRFREVLLAEDDSVEVRLAVFEGEDTATALGEVGGRDPGHESLVTGDSGEWLGVQRRHDGHGGNCGGGACPAEVHE